MGILITVLVTICVCGIVVFILNYYIEQGFRH